MDAPPYELKNKSEIKFPLEYLCDITLEPDEWLVNSLIPLNGIGFLAGPSGSGKSFLALDWALRIALGYKVLGQSSKACGVIYVAAEGANGVRKRIIGWCAHNKTNREHRLALIGNAPDLRQDGDISSLLASISKAGERFDHIGLIVIDTFSQSLAGADENASNDMSKAMKNAGRIAKETGAFVLMVHHTGKEVKKGLRGHSSLFAGADLIIMTNQNNKKEIRIGQVDKQKDGQGGARFAFKLKPITFQNKGVPFSSCVLEYCDVPSAVEIENQTAKKLNDKAINLLKDIQYLYDHAKTFEGSSIEGLSASQKVVKREDVRERCKRSGFSESGEWGASERKAFQNAIDALKAGNKIRVEEPYFWLL